MIRTFVIVVIAVACTFAGSLSAAVPKFGYVMLRAQHPLMQDAFDRYAIALRDRLSSVGLLAFTPLSGDGDAQTPENCKTYGLAGFFVPNRTWHYDSAVVEVHAKLTVIGCDGTIYYFYDVTREYSRDASQEPQAQINLGTADASAALLSNFEAFQHTHQAEWNAMISRSAPGQ